MWPTGEDQDIIHFLKSHYFPVGNDLQFFSLVFILKQTKKKKKSGELLPDIHVKLQASENVKRLLTIDLVSVLMFRVLIRTIKLH